MESPRTSSCMPHCFVPTFHCELLHGMERGNLRERMSSWVSWRRGGGRWREVAASMSGALPPSAVVCSSMQVLCSSIERSLPLPHTRPSRTVGHSLAWRLASHAALVCKLKATNKGDPCVLLPSRGWDAAPLPPPPVAAVSAGRLQFIRALAHPDHALHRQAKFNERGPSDSCRCAASCAAGAAAGGRAPGRARRW